MNEKYKNFICASKLSLYKLSKETGIPYTTLNELMNDKKSINNIASETVFKLCLYFKCQQKDLLNDFCLLDNCQGNYKGTKYQWKSVRDSNELHIYDNNRDITLLRLNKMIPNAYHEYRVGITEIMIDEYKNQKEMEGKLL